MTWYEFVIVLSAVHITSFVLLILLMKLEMKFNYGILNEMIRDNGYDIDTCLMICIIPPFATFIVAIELCVALFSSLMGGLCWLLQKIVHRITLTFFFNERV